MVKSIIEGISPYYVYLHRNIMGNVILVGKGKNHRVLKKDGRPLGWLSKIHSYQIIKDNLTETEALKLEQTMIQHYQSSHLLNITKSNKKLNLEFLREYLEYSEGSPTGLIWRKQITRGRGAIMKQIGEVAGSINTKRESQGKSNNTGTNYCKVSVGSNTNILVHRLIWALHFGQDNMDISVIDHIDGNPLNNKISNLRLTTSATNQKNIRAHHRNKTGNCGITWLEDKKGYRLRFLLNSGKTFSKSFISKQYTKEQSLSLAIAWKIENKELLIANGYSERYIYGNT